MIDVYKIISDPASKVTVANYIASPHDALNGSWFTQKLYVRNDSALTYYEDIALSIVITGTPVPSNVSPEGIVYQLFAGDIEPTVQEWHRLPFHNTIDLGDLGAVGVPDTATYLPFFLRIYVPGNSDIGRVNEAVVHIAAMERAV